jgi:site-specific recombinase XerD
MEPALALDLERSGSDWLDESWRAIAVGFLVEKQGRTGSRRTVETYGQTVARFLDGIGDPASATPLDVHRFAYHPDEFGETPAPSTVTVRLAAISAFYDFARRMGAIEKNPAADIRRPMARRPAPRGLTANEVRRLLSVIPNTRSGLLDRAMILTGVMTGLRRAELVELRVTAPSDDAVLYEVRAKGGRIRRRELPRPAWLAILDAADAAGRPVGNGELVFPVADATFYAHLRRHATAAGLVGVSPHVLRHTAAKLRRKSGASIEDVCSLLGHRSIATTSTYLRELEAERDDGWGGVASALGLIAPRVAAGSPRPHTAAGPQTRLRPVHAARRDGRGNDHPANRIGEHVHAQLPRHKPTARGRRAGAPTDP